MIKVKITKNHLEVSGHARYDDYGKDIVCAAVSSIVITSVNGILKIDKNALKYKEDEGFIKIDIIEVTETTEKLLENMIEMLIELEKDYPKNIKIYKEV